MLQLHRPYASRTAAGREIAPAVVDALATLSGLKDAVVLALPRGGVPIASEVASLLAAPLGIFCVKKITLPANPELAIGAVAESGETFTNTSLAKAFAVSPEKMTELADEVRARLRQSRLNYQTEALPPRLNGLAVVLCDDGAATGATMAAAVHAVLAMAPRCLVVALPVASAQAYDEIKTALSTSHSARTAIVCPLIPSNFSAVGEWYEEFPQLTNEEVITVLDTARLHTIKPMEQAHLSLPR